MQVGGLGGHVFCPVCLHRAEAFQPGPGGRPGARCGQCQSLERHRFLALLLRGLQGAEGHAAPREGWLDVAPTRCITRLQSALGVRQVGIDFDPGADGRDVHLRASITDLPFDDRSVRWLLCYHVLEHVPDDARAVHELHRVIAPGGLALVQVPWRSWRETDEDVRLPAAERTARFGQADHVRWYGRDFYSRLAAGGRTVVQFSPRRYLTTAACTAFGISPDEAVWAIGDGGLASTLAVAAARGLSDVAAAAAAPAPAPA